MKSAVVLRRIASVTAVKLCYSDWFALRAFVKAQPPVPLRSGWRLRRFERVRRASETAGVGANPEAKERKLLAALIEGGEMAVEDAAQLAFGGIPGSTTDYEPTDELAA